MSESNPYCLLQVARPRNQLFPFKYHLFGARMFVLVFVFLWAATLARGFGLTHFLPKMLGFWGQGVMMPA